MSWTIYVCDCGHASMETRFPCSQNHAGKPIDVAPSSERDELLREIDRLKRGERHPEHLYRLAAALAPKIPGAAA